MRNIEEYEYSRFDSDALRRELGISHNSNAPVEMRGHLLSERSIPILRSQNIERSSCKATVLRRRPEGNAAQQDKKDSRKVNIEGCDHRSYLWPLSTRCTILLCAALTRQLSAEHRSVLARRYTGGLINSSRITASPIRSIHNSVVKTMK